MCPPLSRRTKPMAAAPPTTRSRTGRRSCALTAARQFAGLKTIGKLKKDISVLDGGVATKVFLMPAGSGCVSIKKEVVL